MVARSWPLLDPADLDGSVRRWAAVVLPLISDGQYRSRTMASTYIRAFSEAETGTAIAISAARAEQVSQEAVETSLRVNGPVTIRSLTSNGYGLTHAAGTALTAVQGAAMRHVLDAGRDVVVEAAADAGGWRRIGTGSCDFCMMLIGRGEVYSAETARFASHDSCRCMAEPAYDGGEPAGVLQYTASKRSISDTDRQRVRDYLADQRAA